jgi:hypothetical protein
MLYAGLGVEAKEGIEGSCGFVVAGILLVVASTETRHLGIARRPVSVDTRLAATEDDVPRHCSMRIKKKSTA